MKIDLNIISCYSPFSVPNYKCLHCQAEAVALQCTNPDIFVPTCDGDLFAKYQYHEAKNQSFCVYMDGTEITELLPYSTGYCVVSKNCVDHRIHLRN